MNAFVISNNGARFNHTKVILSRVGFNVSLHTPIKYDSDELNSAFSSQYKETKSFKVNSAKNTSYDYAHLNKSSDKLRKTFSNKIAFETILQTFISSDTFGPDEWIFLFEDDIGMQSKVADPYCAIRSAMLIASPSISLPMPVPVRKKKKKNSPPHDKGQRVGDGIIYLGMCRHFTSVCQPLVSTKNEQLPRLDSTIEIQRCFGACAHAFGVVKWKAPFLLSVFRSLHNEFSDYSAFHYFDMGLLLFGQLVHPILLVGSNLPSPQLGHNHLGLFYQDRRRFTSLIDG